MSTRKRDAVFRKNWKLRYGHCKSLEEIIKAGKRIGFAKKPVCMDDNGLFCEVRNATTY